MKYQSRATCRVAPSISHDQQFRPGAWRLTTWQDVGIASPGHDLSELMLRVQSGDQVAFAAVYDELSPVVFGTVKQVLRDPAMSEEVTQEVFVELWRTASRFDAGLGSVATWAVTLARRRAVDRVRREQSQRRRIEELRAQRSEQPEMADEHVLTSMSAQRVRSAMSGLPDEQRQVIQLAFIDGHSHSAIADQLGLPLGTVKGRVRGGLQRLCASLNGES